MTQADVCQPNSTAPTTASPSTAIGLSKWGVDIHAVQRVAALALLSDMFGVNLADSKPVPQPPFAIDSG